VIDAGYIEHRIALNDGVRVAPDRFVSPDPFLLCECEVFESHSPSLDDSRFVADSGTQGIKDFMRGVRSGLDRAADVEGFGRLAEFEVELHDGRVIKLSPLNFFAQLSVGVAD
jgi:hypothetical protein